MAPWTIRNYLVVLKTALTWAAGENLLTALPVFPKIQVPKKKPQPIPEADWLRLLAQSPDLYWRAFLLCGWYGGLRLSEARHLQRRRSDKLPWVDWENSRIVLPAEFAKTQEDQWVPLHPRLRDELAALPDWLGGAPFFDFRDKKTGQPLTRNQVSTKVRWLARKAGVQLSMHRLRNGFGCRVAQQLGKGNAPILHRLMRHSSMQMTMEFYANVDDVLHESINQLDTLPKLSDPGSDLSHKQPSPEWLDDSTRTP